MNFWCRCRNSSQLIAVWNRVCSTSGIGTGHRLLSSQVQRKEENEERNHVEKPTVRNKVQGHSSAKPPGRATNDLLTAVLKSKPSSKEFRHVLPRFVTHSTTRQKHLNTVLYELRKENRIQDILHTLQIARFNQFELNEYHFTTAVSALKLQIRENYSWKSIRELFVEIANCSSTSEAFESTAGVLFLTLLRSPFSKHLFEVLDCLHESKVNLTCRTYNYIISNLRHLKKHDAVISVYNHMLKVGVEPDSRACSYVLRALYDGGCWESSLEMLDQMIEDGITEDGNVMSSLLDILLQEKEVGVAVAIVRQMLNKGIQVHPSRYTQLITACGKWRMLSQAIDLFHKIPKEQKNEAHYGAIMATCVQCNNINLALKYFEKCKESIASLPEKPMMDKHYNILLHGYAQLGDWENTEVVFEQMIDNGVNAEKYQFNSLLLAYDKGNQWGKLSVTFEEMRNCSIEIDLVTFTTMIQACERLIRNTGKSAIKKALQLYNEAQSSNLDLDYYFYRPLITICVLESQNQLAVELYEEAVKKQILPDHDPSGVIDLHYRNQELARTALVSWLRHYKRDIILGKDINLEEIHIITGWGKHSSEYGISPLKTSVLNLLSSGLGQPLQYYVPSHNKGAVTIVMEDFRKWIENQHQCIF